MFAKQIYYLFATQLPFFSMQQTILLATNDERLTRMLVNVQKQSFPVGHAVDFFVLVP
jgi:neutral trehalase